MTLSRMDEEESPLKLSDFAVSEAVEETAESFRDFARSQGHPLELAIVPGLTYCGDEYAVRQLVSIREVCPAGDGHPVCAGEGKTGCRPAVQQCLCAAG